MNITNTNINQTMKKSVSFSKYLIDVKIFNCDDNEKITNHEIIIMNNKITPVESDMLHILKNKTFILHNISLSYDNSKCKYNIKNNDNIIIKVIPVLYRNITKNNTSLINSVYKFNDNIINLDEINLNIDNVRKLTVEVYLHNDNDNDLIAEFICEAQDIFEDYLINNFSHQHSNNYSGLSLNYCVKII
jgi:hypothetical protein